VSLLVKSDLAGLILGAAALIAGLPCAAATIGSVVTEAVDDQRTIVLAGNTRPEATIANDRGALPDGAELDQMQLLLKRPAETESALGAFIDGLHDHGSASYHHWLTATAFGERFGPSAQDVDAVVGWLARHGFVVNGISPGRTMIDFSGTAADVREAFHTEIHRLEVNGVSHIANMAEPQIPAALAGVVSGVVSLNDFRPRSHLKPRPNYTYGSGGSKMEVVVPADLATIYNLNPLFAAGISGQGQTVVVIENTNVYDRADWGTFRSKFGLEAHVDGSLAEVHPQGSSACRNPGLVDPNEAEAAVDAEWASAAAPSAAIDVAACADTATTFGGLIALQNLINAANPPAVISISYGECEAENGATQNAAYALTYQQAVAEGISVFVSAGDEGAASCDPNTAVATHGIGVSGLASTPYNVAVGGTDFADTYAGTTGLYWNNRNAADYASAKSYVPEIPWNNSCASALIAANNGFNHSYGSDGFCNYPIGWGLFLSTQSGSGGPSGCATGSPSIQGVVSGSCKGHPKPSWQDVLGNPSDRVRDIPDVSLFAADGIWNHLYAYCDSDIYDGGYYCTGAPRNWSAGGGTSFSAPIMAGILALVNQKTGERQGNPNPTLYRLAAREYGTSGPANCDSSMGNTVSPACIFYNVTQGDMDVNCTGAHNCYLPSGTNGVLSTRRNAFDPAYRARKGWNFATGIGTVNAANLVNNW
jgi:subtilase family serine protease